MEDRLLLNDRTSFVLYKGIEIEIRRAPFDDYFVRMQLRQFPPDVISDVVVWFVVCFTNEIFHAHNSRFQNRIPFAFWPRITRIGSELIRKQSVFIRGWSSFRAQLCRECLCQDRK